MKTAHVWLPTGFVVLVASLGSQPSAAQWTPPGRLDDTGLTSCLARDGETILNDCTGTGQDGEFGRDVTANKPNDGVDGFSYQKIDADGVKLPRDAVQWSCTLDKVTRLLWEIKTPDGLHGDGHTYTNYGDGRAGDSSAFVAAVNAEGFCGHRDWRMPRPWELQGLINYGRSDLGPVIDMDWFPRSVGAPFWSATPTRSSPPDGVFVDFFDGYMDGMTRGVPLPVRLVRSESNTWESALSAQGSGRRYVPFGDEVADLLTGLIWRRCSQGQTWTGRQCAGQAAEFDWQSAVDEGRAIAARTGVAWRVPDIKEAFSLIKYPKTGPRIDARAFPDTPASVYWSSSYNAGFPYYAWAVNFGAGVMDGYGRTNRLPVRLVRSAF